MITSTKLFLRLVNTLQLIRYKIARQQYSVKISQIHVQLYIVFTFLHLQVIFDINK